jgi:hypothetical protein
MFELHLKANKLSDFPELAVLDQNSVNKAMARALLKLSKWLKTHALRAITQQTGIMRKTLSPRFYISKPRTKAVGISAGLWIGTYKIPLYEATGGKVRQTKTGVSSKFGTIDHAFLVTMKSGKVGVFKRKGRAKFPIVEQSLDFATMAEESLQKLLKTKTQTRFVELLQHELSFLFKKQAA